MNFSNFTYADEYLSNYLCMTCSFNGVSLDTLSSGSDLTFDQASPSGAKKFHLHSSHYDSPYQATFQICKSPCLAGTDNMELTPTEISALQRWLCRDEYHRFSIDQDGFEQVHWNATFSSKIIELGGVIVGLELTMTTDAPFAYKDEVESTHTLAANGSFSIVDQSDEVGYIYPTVSIKLLTAGDFIMTNSIDSNFRMTIQNCVANETITLSGESLIISTDNTNHKKTLPSDFNYNFPKIINSYSTATNTYTTNLACEITVTYTPVIKIGM